MKTDLHHAAVFARDLDRSLLLFKDVLGFRELWRTGSLGGRGMASLFGMEDMEAVLVMLQSPGERLRLELVHLTSPAPVPSPGPPAPPAAASLALMVPDLETLHRRLTAEGWRPCTPVASVPTPTGETMRMFCLRTEEDVLLEFIEAPRREAGQGG